MFAKLRRQKLFIPSVILGVCVVALLALVFGPRLLNPPKDNDKAYDLYTLQAAVEKYYFNQKPQHLPDNIGQLEPHGLRGQRGDYTYKRIDSFMYQLCATFGSDGPALKPYGFPDYTKHRSGKKCFEIDVFNPVKGKYSLGDYPKELQDYFAQ